MDSMLRHTFQPDYTVRACTEVLYMKLRRNLYMAAKRATLMERSQKDNVTNSPVDQFDDEVEKVRTLYFSSSRLNSLDNLQEVFMILTISFFWSVVVVTPSIQQRNLKIHNNLICK